MIIFKDIISGDELFSDSFPMKLIDGLYYEVEGKTVAENSGGIDESLIGGNKSAEEPGDEEYNADTTYGVNIIINHRLTPAPAYSVKEYMTVLKPYVKAVHGKLEKSDAEGAALFKNGIPAVVKKLKAIWSDLVLYQGESEKEEDHGGMISFLNYRENGDPYMIFFKHGLVEEKV